MENGVASVALGFISALHTVDIKAQNTTISMGNNLLPPTKAQDLNAMCLNKFQCTHPTVRWLWGVCKITIS